MTPRKDSKLEIFTGWKEIANYLRKGVRSVQRYEREMGLPIRRPAGKLRGSVMATRAELDAWIAASPIRDAFQLRGSSDDTITHLAEFKRNLAVMAQLREQSLDLRQKLSQSLSILRESLQVLTSDGRQTLGEQSRLLSEQEHESLTNVLVFGSKRSKVN